jgi:hypothetical protein
MQKLDASSFVLAGIVLFGISPLAHAANSVVSVPEPATGLLLLAGLAGGFVMRQLKK